jgi:protein-tyrosine phosphatase
MTKILFVCTGNICRSQMAQMMLENKVNKMGISSAVFIDSAGISSDEQGNLIDIRAKKVLEKENIPVLKHHARKITKNDIQEFDLIIVMTHSHYNKIEQMSNAGKIHLLNSFNPIYSDVPFMDIPDIEDPWYGDYKDFEKTFDEINMALPLIIHEIK